MADIAISQKYEPLFEWLTAQPGDPLYKVDTVVETGGRYSAKSYTTGLFSCIAAKDFNHRLLYTRYTLTSAEDSIIPEFTEKLDVLNCHAAFEVKKDRIAGTRNNSKIVFKGIRTSSGNQTANLKSLKDFSMFVLEEAEEMPTFDNWDKIKKSIRALDVRNLSILILNPTTKAHWIYEELFEGRGVPEGFNGVVGNVLYIHTSYRDLDRQFIPDTIYEEYEGLRTTYEYYHSLCKQEKEQCEGKVIKAAKYYQHTIMGGWLDKAEGVVFTNWTTGPFQEVSPLVYGQDYGFSIDPTTLVATSIDKAHKRIYLKELLYKQKLTTSEIAAENKQHAGRSVIYADSAEPRLISELVRHGCNIQPAIKGQGSVSAGIALLQDYELVVDPMSVNLVKELNNYVWNDRKSGTPLDAYNHILDAVRYAVTPQLQPKAGFGYRKAKR